MLAKVADAFLLLALTVIIHGAGLTIVLRRLPLWKTADDAGFISRTWLLIQLASWAITIHMVEIAMWGLFFWWKKCLPDFESSLYFAVVTYTTVGYGDLVLAKGWRLVAGVEALMASLCAAAPPASSSLSPASCTVRAWAQDRIEMMKPSIHWLLVFIPITVVLEHDGTLPPPVIFFSAAPRAPHQSNIII